MGFSTLIDILGSSLIGGMILLILLRMNDSSVESHYLNSGELIVQTNLVSVVNLLEYDLRKVGYCEDWEKIPDPAVAILAASNSSITFLSDVAQSKINHLVME
jgi:type II secretory pathway component PulJ